jgi:hypothetical protein
MAFSSVRLPVHQLHDEQLAPNDGFQGVDLSDVRVIERGEKLGLPFKAGQTVGIPRELLGKELHRHIAPENRISRSVHLSHPARAELLDSLVMANSPANHE